MYITAYIVGCNWKKLTIGRKTLVYSFAAVGFAIVGRLAGRMLCDESILYNVFIAGYTHVVLAFGIFFAVAYIYKCIEDRRIPVVVQWLDQYSYEIYLVHFMFYTGPFFFGITDVVIVNWVLIIVASIVAAIILKTICGWIFKLFNLIENKRVV